MSVQVLRKVLRMVSELHLRGYQLLRIAPGMSPSGMHWRCSVTPVSNILETHGARMHSWDTLAAHYTSGMERNFFDWRDARHATPSKLADLFIARFPEIAAAGRGSDWPYAGWYVEMLHLTYPDRLPIAYADYFDEAIPLVSIGGERTVPLPMPPSGLAPREGSVWEDLAG